MPARVGAEECDACIQAWPLLQEIALGTSVVGLLRQVAIGFQHLTTVSTRGYVGVNNSNEWDIFFENVNTNLRHVGTHTHVSNRAFAIMAARCPQLQSLRLCSLTATDETLAIIGKACPKLAVVSFILSPITEHGLFALAQGGNMREIRTTIAPGIALQRCPDLRVLDLLSSHDNISPTLLQLGAHCPKLRKLAILGTHNSFGSSYDDSFVAFAEGCPVLEALEMTMPLTDTKLVALARHCPELSSLVVMDGSAVTDVGICALVQGCRKLRFLSSFEAPGVTTVGITALTTHCPLLRKF
jgi:hypothetical protein